MLQHPRFFPRLFGFLVRCAGLYLFVTGIRGATTALMLDPGALFSIVIPGGGRGRGGPDLSQLWLAAGTTCACGIALILLANLIVRLTYGPEPVPEEPEHP